MVESYQDPALTKIIIINDNQGHNQIQVHRLTTTTATTGTTALSTDHRIPNVSKYQFIVHPDSNETNQEVYRIPQQPQQHQPTTSSSSSTAFNTTKAMNLQRPISATGKRKIIEIADLPETQADSLQQDIDDHDNEDNYNPTIIAQLTKQSKSKTLSSHDLQKQLHLILHSELELTQPQVASTTSTTNRFQQQHYQKHRPLIPGDDNDQMIDDIPYARTALESDDDDDAEEVKQQSRFVVQKPSSSSSVHMSQPQQQTNSSSSSIWNRPIGDILQLKHSHKDPKIKFGAHSHAKTLQHYRSTDLILRNISQQLSKRRKK
jgi:hypothetical protein